MSHLTAAIDIGSNSIRVVAGEFRDDKIALLARASALSAGVRGGYITNKSEAYMAVKKAIRLTEKQLGQRIEEIHVTAGGGPLSTKILTSSVAVSHGEGYVTDVDIENATKRSIKKSLLTNQRSIDSIVLNYVLDGVSTVSEPLGMQGKKLDVEVMLFNYAGQNMDAAEDILDQVEVSVTGFFPSIIASSIVSLTTIDRKVGCVLIDIGSDATSYVVYEQDTPIHIGLIDIGGDAITQSLALEFQISVQDAEIIKQGGPIQEGLDSNKVASSIKKSTTDLFKRINADLKTIDKSGNLPGGAILCGGGAMLHNIELTAREILKIPTRKASVRAFKHTDSDERELAWASVYGLAVRAMEQERYQKKNIVGKIFRNAWSSTKKLFA